MKKTGIALIILQILGLLGSIISNGSPIPLPDSGTFLYVTELIGYFLPAIIGIILIIRANSKKK